MSETKSKIDSLLFQIQTQPQINSNNAVSTPRRPPTLGLGGGEKPQFNRRPGALQIREKLPEPSDIDKKLRDIMKISGELKINDVTYNTDIKDMEYIEELGHGTCGQVVKMRHKLSGEIIAVKQMRRSLNTEENKRIVMDIEVVLKSYDCKYIVQCLGCFITDSEVWICMELMNTCFDKLLKRLQQPIPEYVLGKVTVATVKALSYLKDKHGVIHRDVKPSNILLDERGNVKLCDFGISGRLVDSRAKTRSAGCAAYMAPERIELSSSDYDIRADVWSLGITLVELATGVLPYQDCKNDFEVLAKVIGQEPPSLPADKDFSTEFRTFVKLCLTKDEKERPKYHQLQDEAFIKIHESATTNVDDWFANAIRQAEDVLANRSTPRHTPSPSLKRQPSYKAPSHPRQASPAKPFVNGNSSAGVSPLPPKTESPEVSRRHSNHVSRLSTFQNSTDHVTNNHQRNYLRQVSPRQSSLAEKSHHQSNLENSRRSYSPFQSYQNHIQVKNASNLQDDIGVGKSQRRVDSADVSPFTSPLMQRKMTADSLSSPYPQRKNADGRWSSPLGSPLPLRNHFHNDEQQPYHIESTSPIVLQRFYHQQKQQQQAREAEETAKTDTGKKRFASYIKLQLSGDRSGRSSRHQSPEPPPRLSRAQSGDQSPLATRRNYMDGSMPGSPSLSRRYVSPTPPIPPPRRLSESSSVPGSPQHLRARFHYTPEPQRRLFQNNDVS